jgi:leucyl-tRNA synthetase
MHRKFDHKAIESKWQNSWQESGLYTTDSTSDKPKCFVLDMFPYPSGEGLHVGHPKGYIATDIYSRFKRMTGHEVLHPMGWDAFGLPAENYAIKNKIHPATAVDENVTKFKKQLEILGMDYDWGREINTTDPAFYKWTQWIFIQLLKNKLAFESNEPINWCPGCQTGLANEDLESDGTCERCDSVVEKRPMRQWVLNIRAYADRMLEDLDTLQWPEHIKEAQRNWIGRSEGAEIDFKLSIDETVSVFTTRPDTLYGATYMVLAPELDLVIKHRASITNWGEVELYIKEAANKKEMDRLDDTKEKTGVKLEGITATNPASGEEIPVYIADYVLGSYGTGAIMAVPAHDERDFAFATKFGIEIKQVVAPIFEGEGDDAPRSDLETVPARDCIDVIIEHPTDGTFLLQREKDGDRDLLHFVGGGTDGEEDKIAVGRELLEETGFSNFKFVSEECVFRTKSIGFRHSKNVNQQGVSGFYHVKLTDLDQVESEIEEGKHTVEWVSKDEVAEMITWQWHSRAWNAYQNNEIHCGSGVLVHSAELDGMDSEEAKAAIVEKVGGRMTKTYKIKDWVFSRQRYWGEPIPVVHGADGTVYPIAEEQLPVTLPEVDHYEPSGDGQSPLAKIDDWVNVTGYLNEIGDFVVADSAPTGQELLEAKRETNTMPQWAGSSWYYLRYIDPNNTEALVDPELEKAWQPVDVYVGGDHAVRHLIYARFWHKFLYDQGVVSTLEPFQRLEFLGFILAADGRKMSKRWGNVINPDDIVALVGADTLRVYEMFMGPFENTIAWSQDGLVGARRFLERVNGLNEHVLDGDTTESAETLRQLHKTIKKVSVDIEGFKFNTAVSAMMIFINTAEKEGLSGDSYATFLQLLAPFAPHLSEELYREHGEVESIHLSTFPTFDPLLAKDSAVTIGVQINGKVRGDITIAPDATEEVAVAEVKNNQQLQAKLEEGEIVKTIYVPGRILNFILK